MSSHLKWIERPQDVIVLTANHFVVFNETAIVDHFYRKWTQMSRFFDTKSVTNITIPSFRLYCIAISSSESYKWHFVVNVVDMLRVSTLLIGFILFTFGPNISRSVIFYYTSCISLGIFASFLLIFLIIGRYLPRKISALIIMLGSSTLVFAFKILWQTFEHFLIENSFYLIIYLILSALISFALAYRFGPITNHRTLNLMQWFLQLIGLIFMVISCEIYEYSMLFILSIILVKVLPFKGLFYFKRRKVKVKLLTEVEFELQSDVQTKQSLEELRKYCLSSQCNAWHIICQLKDPIRFARFVDGDNHISDDEIIAFEIDTL
ncbi:nuclear envelope integral membrane protein 1-like [Oppia nitens]|uniref:nuclear envelope integral membrane protein 1-like n=1 Tax=Oppia nitens TaxID=1686743 RepID=UPI0023D9C201|nr:nuclear envelope integral membrane protein 1-like [Oppia nitens]